MTGPITRKIEIARQIEEMRRLIGANEIDYPALVRRRALRDGEANERLARQRGILATLEFCALNEGEFRDFIKARRAGA